MFQKNVEDMSVLYFSPPFKAVTVKVGKNLCIKILLKQQMLLLVFVQFSSWSSDVGLTVHSFSVHIFSVLFCTKIFCNKYGTVF